MIQRWRWRTLHPSVLQQAVHLCHLPQRAWVRGPDDHDNDHDAEDYHDDDTITIMMRITMMINITIVIIIRLFTSTLDKSRVGATSMRFVWTSLASFLLDKSGKCFFYFTSLASFFTRQVWQVFLMDKSVKFFNGGVWQVLLLDKSSKFFYFTSLASGNRSCITSIMNEHHIWIHLNLSVKLHNFSKLLPGKSHITTWLNQNQWQSVTNQFECTQGSLTTRCSTLEPSCPALWCSRSSFEMKMMILELWSFKTMVVDLLSLKMMVVDLWPSKRMVVDFWSSKRMVVVNSNEDYPHQLVEPHSSLADMYDFLLQYIQVWFKKRFEKRLKKYIQVEYHQSITIFQYVHESIFFPQYTRVRSNQYTARQRSQSHWPT